MDHIALGRTAARFPGLRPLCRALRSSIVQRAIVGSTQPPFANGRRQIEVVGRFEEASGIGESGRLCASNLSAHGWDVVLTDTSQYALDLLTVESMGPTSRADSVGLRIWHLNPPMLAPEILRFGVDRFRTCYNVGYWAWELDSLPREWIRALNYVNALFVPSTFTRDAFKSHTECPVLVVPHPVRVQSYDPNVRSKLGIPDDAFLVSSVFNYGSSFERKNPLATVAAFDRAFAGSQKTWLVLKTSQGALFPADRDRLRAATFGHGRISVVDETWDSKLVHGLLATSDAYLSLHRAEGFGLTIAEAMLHQTPVVVTAWSGNMDFCSPETAYLVDVKLVPVKTSHPELRNMPNAVWAEPAIDQAIAHLREIRQNRAAAHNRAQNGSKALKRFLAANSYENALHIVRSTTLGDPTRVKKQKTLITQKNSRSPS